MLFDIILLVYQDKTKYVYKFYDKGTQGGLEYQLLRFERHLQKTAEARKVGIITINDLRDKSKLEALAENLIRGSKEIVLAN